MIIVLGRYLVFGYFDPFYLGLGFLFKKPLGEHGATEDLHGCFYELGGPALLQFGILILFS